MTRNSELSPAAPEEVAQTSRDLNRMAMFHIHRHAEDRIVSQLLHAFSDLDIVEAQMLYFEAFKQFQLALKQDSFKWKEAVTEENVTDDSSYNFNAAASWLYTTAYRIGLKRIKEIRILAPLEDELLELKGFGIEFEDEPQEEWCESLPLPALLLEALAGLDVRKRAIMLLSCFTDLDSEGIAEEVNRLVGENGKRVTSANVRVLKARAKKALCNALKAYPEYANKYFSDLESSN